MVRVAVNYVAILLQAWCYSRLFLPVRTRRYQPFYERQLAFAQLPARWCMPNVSAAGAVVAGTTTRCKGRRFISLHSCV